MAKTSSINKNKRREKMAKQYAGKRAKLKAMAVDDKLTPEDRFAARIKLAELYSKESMAREAIDEFSRAAEQLREAGRTDDFMKVAERLLFHSPDNRPVS